MRLCAPFCAGGSDRVPTPRAQDKHEIFFNFSAPFEIHDDNEILKRMSMHRCVAADLGDLVPPSLEQYTAQWLELQKSQPAK